MHTVDTQWKVHFIVFDEIYLACTAVCNYILNIILHHSNNVDVLCWLVGSIVVYYLGRALHKRLLNQHFYFVVVLVKIILFSLIILRKLLISLLKRVLCWTHCKIKIDSLLLNINFTVIPLVISCHFILILRFHSWQRNFLCFKLVFYTWRIELICVFAETFVDTRRIEFLCFFAETVF